MPNSFDSKWPHPFPQALKPYTPDPQVIEDSRCRVGSKTDMLLGLKLLGVSAVEWIADESPALDIHAKDLDLYADMRPKAFLQGPTSTYKNAEGGRVCPGRNDPQEPCPKTVERSRLLRVAGRPATPSMPFCVFSKRGSVEMFYSEWISSGPAPISFPNVVMHYEI